MGESDSLFLNISTSRPKLKQQDQRSRKRLKPGLPDEKLSSQPQKHSSSDANFSQKKKTGISECEKTSEPYVGTSLDARFEKKRKKKVDESVDSEASSTTVFKPKRSHHFASLFVHNPEIPHVELGFVKPKQEPLFSSQEFSDLPIHPYLVSCLTDRLQVTKLTSVQQRTIPILLEGKDCLVKSATGSGKTLAFAVPIVHSLQSIKPKLQRSDGVHALIIVPTRELAIQCYEHFSTLCRSFTWLVPGCLMGGEKKKSEKARIRKGVTILIATPGRLLDHLKHTTNLSLKKVQWLIIDEADRLQDLGFEQTISEIVSILIQQRGTERQTVLLSATLTKGVEKLAGMSLTDPAIVDVAAGSENSSMSGEEFVVPSQLQQNFIITPVKLRLVSLSAFIVDKCSVGSCKVVIFMMTQDVVDFHYSLFKDVLQGFMKEGGLEVSFFHLHGNMNQQERMEVFKEFREAKSGVLLCTDVAARGLDIPHVNWIVQYSAPGRPEDYVHRVGRTARIGSEGHSLLFLLPTEVGFIDLLQQHKIQLKEVDMQDLLHSLMLLGSSENRKSKNRPHSVQEHASSLQANYENCVYSHSALLESAEKAYASYIRAYSSYPISLREILPFKSLHLGHAAKSLCLRDAPSVVGHKQAVVAQKSAKGHIQKPRSESQQKRKIEISEFDSGLDFGKRKKRKT